MEISAAARAQRDRIRLSRMLDNLARDTKSLRSLALALGRDDDARHLADVIRCLDKAQQVLSDPSLLHPTLF